MAAACAQKLTARVSYNGNTLASQARAVGSIPIARSTFLDAPCHCKRSTRLRADPPRPYYKVMVRCRKPAIFIDAPAASTSSEFLSRSA